MFQGKHAFHTSTYLLTHFYRPPCTYTVPQVTTTNSSKRFAHPSFVYIYRTVRYITRLTLFTSAGDPPAVLRRVGPG